MSGNPEPTARGDTVVLVATEPDRMGACLLVGSVPPRLLRRFTSAFFPLGPDRSTAVASEMSFLLWADIDADKYPDGQDSDQLDDFLPSLPLFHGRPLQSRAPSCMPRAVHSGAVIRTLCV